MSQPVIAVTGLGKRYHLSHQKRHGTLRDSLTDGVRNFFKNISGHGETFDCGHEEFWALRDVSFEINPGDVVGIIGRNGAGKSTLLKVLSRITEPTTGRATIRGRVASLLEVGTGFHPELSGRENIFLNGAILGMSRVEIQRKFDEIVAFAEVERFLDTQVKHYSSGMYVRLAFAVAAHLEPEILIVDEVLAVGDAQFQKKCLGKMNEVARNSGRTVLFVSHNTSALQAICRTGICLQQGRVVNSGSMSDCLSAYLGSGAQTVVFSKSTSSKPGITSVTINPAALTEGDLQVEVGFTSPFPLAPMVGVILYNRHGQPLMGANGRMAGDSWRPTPALSGVVIAQLKQLPLHSDSYRLSVWLGDAGMNYDEKRDVVEFDFVSHRFHPQAPPVEVMGPIDLPWRWSIKPGE